MAFITTSKKVFFRLFPLVLSLVLSACQSNLQRCMDHSSGLTPLYDLDSGQYLNYTGGLYPNGSNRIPAHHFSAGVEAGSFLQPLNSGGEPVANGQIGLVSLGYSTAAMTTQYLRFIHQIKQEWPAWQIANAAQAGRDINAMIAVDGDYWKKAKEIIAGQGLTPAQVQIIWLSTGDASVYDLPFPEQSLVQVEKYRSCLELIKKNFPNVRIVFISDRAYGGYISEKSAFPLREPAAWYTSWAVKWVIEAQINHHEGFGTDSIPFIDWGPTLWTDGIAGDAQGYTWSCNDAGKGGIHPSAIGRAKEASRLYIFLRDHPYLAGNLKKPTSP